MIQRLVGKHANIKYSRITYLMATKFWMSLNIRYSGYNRRYIDSSSMMRINAWGSESKNKGTMLFVYNIVMIGLHCWQPETSPTMDGKTIQIGKEVQALLFD